MQMPRSSAGWERPETIRQYCRQGCWLMFRGFADRLLVRWLSPYVDAILSYRLAQTCALMATFINCMILEEKLNVGKINKATTSSRRARLCFGLSLGTAVTLVYLLKISDQLIVCTSYPRFLLFNSYLIRNLVPQIGFWIDQQVSDTQFWSETSVFLLQLAMLLAPMRTVIGLLAFITTSFALFLIVTTEISGRILVFLKEPLLPLFENQLLPMRMLRSITERTSVWLERQCFNFEQSYLSSLELYRATPINPRQIRLLKLARKLPLLGPRFSVLVVDIDRTPQFEALSHAWEYPPKPIKVSVNRSAHMVISSRLHRFLSHRQSYISTKLIWIDAICIDQENTKEREEQVLLMKNIYGTAANVVVWLQESESREDAIRLWFHWIWTRLIQSAARDPHDLVTAVNPTPRTVKVLQDLLSNRWFSRLWTLQELALGKRVLLLYGDCCFEWWELDEFTTFFLDPSHLLYGRRVFGKSVARTQTARNIQMKANIQKLVRLNFSLLSQKNHPEAVTAHSELFNRSKLLSLETILGATAFFDVTDSRDKIFALLGIVDSPATELPIPNYRSSFREVYRDMVIKILSDGNFKDVSLRRTGIGLRRNGLAEVFRTLPSWMPDLISMPELTGIVEQNIRSNGSIFIELDQQATTMTTQVRFIDRIQQLGPEGQDSAWAATETDSSTLSTASKDSLSWILDTKNFAKAQADQNAAINSSFREFDEASFWRTLFTNSFGDQTPISSADMDFLITDAENICRFIVSDRLSDASGLNASYLSSRSEFFRLQQGVERISYSAAARTLGRRFGTSNRGNYLLTPPFAKEDDVICMFGNLPVPFLIRATDDDQWVIVGACYMDKFEVPSEETQPFKRITII